MRIGRQVLQHGRHRHDAGPVDLERLADRIVRAKIATRHAPREHQAVGAIECGLQVSGIGRQRQDIEDVRVGPVKTPLERFDVPVTEAHGLRKAAEPRHPVDLRQIELQLHRHPRAHVLGRELFIAGQPQAHRELVDVLVPGNEMIERRLVTNEQSDQKRRREADGQSDDVDRRVQTVAGQVSQSGGEVVSEHDASVGAGARVTKCARIRSLRAFGSIVGARRCSKSNTMPSTRRCHRSRGSLHSRECAEARPRLISNVSGSEQSAGSRIAESVESEINVTIWITVSIAESFFRLVERRDVRRQEIVRRIRAECEVQGEGSLKKKWALAVATAIIAATCGKSANELRNPIACRQHGVEGRRYPPDPP